MREHNKALLIFLAVFHEKLLVSLKDTYNHLYMGGNKPTTAHHRLEPGELRKVEIMYQLKVATEATYLYIPVTAADEIAAAEREAAINRQIAFDDARDELVGLIKTHPMHMCVEALEFAVIELLNASAAVGADGVEEVLDIFTAEFNAGWQMTNSGVAKIDTKELTIQAGQTIRGFQHVDVPATAFGLPATDDTVGDVLRPLLVTVTTAEGDEMFWATDWLTYEDDLGVEIVRWMM